jgi:hypothetical protein
VRNGREPRPSIILRPATRPPRAIPPRRTNASLNAIVRINPNLKIIRASGKSTGGTEAETGGGRKGAPSDRATSARNDKNACRSSPHFDAPVSAAFTSSYHFNASYPGVESRSGAVARRLRFQIPLIKLAGQLSCSQLSDKGHLAFAHGMVVLKWLKRVRPSVASRYSSE